MICAYCDASGAQWTDELEAELTMARLMARFSYWRKHPPLPVMVRALAIWAGAWEPPKPKLSTEDTMQKLRSLFPTGKITGTG